MKTEKILTVTEFSVRARMGVTTVYRLINEGKINFVERRKGTQMIKYIPESELKKYVDE